MLMVCVAAPTESPGDDQEGVRGSARLEAGELEESQRTLLSVWCEDMMEVGTRGGPASFGVGCLHVCTYVAYTICRSGGRPVSLFRSLLF